MKKNATVQTINACSILCLILGTLSSGLLVFQRGGIVIVPIALAFTLFLHAALQGISRILILLEAKSDNKTAS